MLSETLQEDMPLNMFVYPVRQGAALPEVFTQFAVVPDAPLSLPPEEIAANRDAVDRRVDRHACCGERRGRRHP